MTRKLFVVMLALIMTPPMAAARQVGGKYIPETMRVGKNILHLNGAGIRKKFFVSIYAGGLYLTHKTHDAKKIMDADEPMAVRMHMMTGLMTPDMMADALRESLQQVAKGDFPVIKDRAERFIRAQKIKVGNDDICDYVYIPGEGLRVLINGKRAVTVKGLDFKKAVFGMWLSDVPCDEALKEDLLGR